MYKTKVRGVIVEGNKSYKQITQDIAAPIEGKTPKWWFMTMGVGTLMMLVGLVAIYNTISTGIGTWGLNNSVAWGWGIINFVWWIGIGHADLACIFHLSLSQYKRPHLGKFQLSLILGRGGYQYIFYGLCYILVYWYAA